MRRYPVQPLLAATGLTLNGFIRTLMPSVNGVYYRKARDEGLTADQADRWACAAGLHPYEVWPEMAEHALEDTSKPCAECGTVFHPRQETHRFCSKPCGHRFRNRESFRRRYRTDPVFREAHLTRVRRDQADPRVAEVRRIKQRLRDRRKDAA